MPPVASARFHVADDINLIVNRGDRDSPLLRWLAAVPPSARYELGLSMHRAAKAQERVPKPVKPHQIGNLGYA